MKISIIFFVFVVISTSLVNAQKKVLSDYDISWTTPGMNSQGSIPLGNGDIGINAWVEENGDLAFYVSKTDAWNENGHLLKLGKISISLHPNPYNIKSFSQKLELEKGDIILQYGAAQIKLWVDANHPTIQIDIDSKLPLNVQVSFETWRRTRVPLTGTNAGGLYGVSEVDKNKNFVRSIFREADTLLPNANNQIFCCHHNSYSQWKANLALQSLDDFSKDFTDPLLNRTFGICIGGNGLVNEADTCLKSRKALNHFQINVYALTQTGPVDSWKNKIVKNVAAINKISAGVRASAHHKWWRQFWNRSYVFITSRDTAVRHQAETVTQGYLLQHFINACGGRGNSPIKFNGSIFTVDTYNRKGTNVGNDADFRLWGAPYWWQNTRLPYWSMLIAGDFEMMKPLFTMYMNALPLRKAATQKYYQHGGAFFPETMNFWGTYTNTNYGTDRTNLPDGFTTNTYIRYYWQSGLELSLMMLDYYSFTDSQAFAKDTLVPFISDILDFFDHHWKRGSDGKIFFSPAMSLETFQTAENPLPEIAGIRKVAEKMLKLPFTFTSAKKRTKWKELINALPALPVKVVGSDTLLAPAAKYNDKKNIENPELYAVFPYRTFGTGKPGIEIAKRTFAARVNKVNGGWQQNSIQAACLGLEDESKRMIVESFSTWDKNFRFPAFWGPNYDWTPDQDHGCVAMNALQRMIIQYEDNKVDLLPAWPGEWDLRFKLNGPHRTIMEGIVENKKLIRLRVTPANRIRLIK